MTAARPAEPVSAPRGPAAKSPTPGAEADRRPVTVLLADLSGFTALSERVDPEDVRAFQNDLFQAMSAEIARFDGFVEKFVGDAVMAVFGAPATGSSAGSTSSAPRRVSPAWASSPPARPPA